MRRKQTVLHTAAAGLLSVCMALSLVGCPEIPGGGYVPPDSPVNSGSSEDSGETGGGGGGGTTSGPVVNDPTTWEVKDNTLSVPSGATVTADAIKQAQGANNNAITAIEFESGVTIGDSAFKNSRITSVTGWENVISIGDNAFKNTNISGELNLSSATTIGASAFEGCTGITGTLNLSSATTIGDNAFKNTKITGTLNLSNATKIGGGAFWNTGVEKVTFGPDVKIEGGGGWEVNGAFTSCTSLTSVTFGGSATVGDCAFYNCKALTNVSGLDKVTFIGNNAFGYTGLTSVKLGAGLTTLEYNAFSGCKSLTSADLSACTELNTIELGMFANCTSLKAVFLAESIAQIGVADGTSVFMGCDNKQVTVYTKRSKEQGEITFGDNDDVDKIKDGEIQYGKTEGDWNTLLEQLHITPDGTSLLSSFSAFRDLLS